MLDDIRIFIQICGYTDLYGFLMFEKTDFYHYRLATLRASIFFRRALSRLRAAVCITFEMNLALLH